MRRSPDRVAGGGGAGILPAPGQLAQRESTRLTREGSLVRSQYCPPPEPAHRAGSLRSRVAPPPGGQCIRGQCGTVRGQLARCGGRCGSQHPTAGPRGVPRLGRRGPSYGFPTARGWRPERKSPCSLPRLTGSGRLAAATMPTPSSDAPSQWRPAAARTVDGQPVPVVLHQRRSGRLVQTVRFSVWNRPETRRRRSRLPARRRPKPPPVAELRRDGRQSAPPAPRRASGPGQGTGAFSAPARPRSRGSRRPCRGGSGRRGGWRQPRPPAGSGRAR